MSANQRLAKYWFTLLLLGAMGCGFTGLAIQSWESGKATLAWPATDGDVTNRSTGNQGQGGAFRINIKYVVDDETYHLVVRDELVFEQRVPVYYNPNHPAEAVVTRGVRWGPFLAFVLLAFMGVFGFLANLALAIWPQLESEDSNDSSDFF